MAATSMTPIRRVDNVDLLQHIVLDRLVVTDIVPRTDVSVIRRILIRYRCWIDDPRTVGTMRSIHAARQPRSRMRPTIVIAALRPESLPERPLLRQIRSSLAHVS